MAVEYRCCDAGFFEHIAIIVVLVLFAGLMSGLTLGLMSLSLVDLEVLSKSGTAQDQKYAAKILPVVKNQHLLLCTLLICNAAAMERDDGSIITDHHEKASVLRQAFKERLGTSVPIDVTFRFEDHLTAHADLESLSVPFTSAEIDSIVADMPIDKAPGPDGFNGLFLKVCWPIIKYDYYRLCNDFWSGIVNLQSINDAYITLIPKVNSPEGPNDYRPISLLNSSFKLLTKILANRLQQKILHIVHKNQYGFLKTRTIQDCVAWAYEYIHQVKQSGRPAVILKLDFTKAFDMIEHEAILRIMRANGFDERWIGWILAIFSTGTSSVLLNGVPGNKFACRRGVRQGDPLSPILFVEGADLLQSLINGLAAAGDLTAPLPIPHSDFPIVQYADDTLVIMQACPRQLLILKSLLLNFAMATGLHVNYSKTCMMPLNIDDATLNNLANVFGCAIGSMPFPYLGLPLGITRPTVHDLSPLSDQIERRLNACARFLDHGGRLTLVRSVLSSLPTHYLCSLKLPKTIIKTFDRARRHCLWAKEEGTGTPHSLAAWSLVCRPKQHGGLGVINLELQNRALLMKHLHKFYCQADTPWVTLVWSLYGQGPPHAQSRRGSFWWKDIFSFVDTYRSITRSEIGNGESTLFWKDFWHEGELLCERFPHLFSFTLNEDISVAQMMHSPNPGDNLALPLSIEAFEELEQAHAILQTYVPVDTALDRHVYVWGNETYTAARFYKFLFAQVPCDQLIKSIWKSKCLPKLKVFLWLMFYDRLNTKDLMNRKHWTVEGGLHCVLCSDDALETRNHLLFDCSFAVSCWNSVNIQWDTNIPLLERVQQAKINFNGPAFMEVFACAAWNIWKTRNDLIFQDMQPSLARWRVRHCQYFSIA